MLLLVGAVVLPHTANAFTAEIVSLTPSATDISDQIGQPGDAPEGVQLFAWSTQADTEYTAVFAVDSEPAMVVTPGGDVSLTSRPSYDVATGEYTVTFTATGINENIDTGGQEYPEGVEMTIMGMMGAVEIGENGPPEEMIGAWMSTDMQQWELLPPSPDKPAFGFELTGPVGTSGYFNMYIPDAMIDLLGQLKGEELTVDELAVFNDDDQATLDITEVDGGAYIQIEITFSETVTEVTSLQAEYDEDADNITKKITLDEKLAVSSAFSSSSVKKGKTAELYGWIKSGKKGETVTVLRKVKGEDSYTKWKTLTTGTNGSYNVKFTAEKTGSYKVKYKPYGGSAKVSPVQKLTVK